MELIKQRAKGIDISSNNHVTGEPIDFLKVKEAGFEFIYVKATQGNDYLNEYLLGDTRRAYDAGLRVGVYHFYDETKGTPEEQADWFLKNGIENVLHNCGNILGLHAILDYEVGAPSIEIRDAFINHLQNEYKRTCGQYMDRSFFATLGHAGAFTWLAWPGWTPSDGEPDGVHCVQYGSQVVPGIDGTNTDVNESMDYHMMQQTFDAPPPTGTEPPNTEVPSPPIVEPPKPIELPKPHTYTFTGREDGLYELKID